MKTRLSLRSMLALLVATIAVLLNGCSNLAPTYSELNPCKTRVIGELSVDTRYYDTCPAIIIKEYGDFRAIAGKPISIDSNGVTFIASEGFFEGKQKFYKNKEISCLIDSTGKAIYGTIPQMYTLLWEVVFSLTNVDTEEEVQLKLEPNKKFDLCLNPGTYNLSIIYFFIGNKYKDLTFLGFPITLDIASGKVNSFGKIIVNSPEKSKNTLEFNCFNLERNDLPHDPKGYSIIGMEKLFPSTWLGAKRRTKHSLEFVPYDTVGLNNLNITFTK